ncbi:MAG: glycerophosphoryl diester phosphodiesterase membrane domain-containing protein [Chloroflexales bacterium]|nr:glycerophosphoryl diester phosphodiesterase membrane domain-containing protein [Chloroflexales bacterium]
MEQAPHLRPLDLSDLLDTTFRLYRNNFLTFLGIAALLQTPMLILQLLIGIFLNRGISTDMLQLMRELPAFDPGTDSFADLSIGNFAAYIGFSLALGLIQAVVVQQLVNGALANAISRRYMAQPISMLEAYNIGLSQIVALIVAGLIVYIITGFIASVVFGCGLLGSVFVMGTFVQQVGVGDGIGITPFMIMALLLLGLLVLGIGLVLLVAYVAIRLLFVPQAIIIEKKGVIDSLQRSWQLVRGSFWRVLGIVLVIYFLIQILIFIPTSSLEFAVGGVFNTPDAFVLRQSILTVVVYLIQILVLPFNLIAYTLLYYDLRVRKEGYDLQLRAASISSTYQSQP